MNIEGSGSGSTPKCHGSATLIRKNESLLDIVHAVVVVAADFLPAHEPVRVHEGETFQQRLHIHQGEPSHHAGSLNRRGNQCYGSGLDLNSIESADPDSQFGSRTRSRQAKIGSQKGKS
jgi:hypothetical protein